MQETPITDSPLPTPVTVSYWLKGESTQNFGDFLTEYFLKHLFLTPSVAMAGYKLVGSVIEYYAIKKDLEKITQGENGTIAYWCCGMREDAPLTPELRGRCQFFGIRGPLSRNLLGLPEDTVMGDPGFLMPILFQPTKKADTRGKNICVPHINDKKSDEELLKLSGTEMVLRPTTKNSLTDLERIIDQIASAKFVLAGSLHAAIIACAYDVPFAFWDNGHVDIPFKWRDTAALLDISASFVPNLKEGKQIYDSQIKPRLKKPPMLPMLKVAPFVVRPAVLLRAAVSDGLINKNATQGAEKFLKEFYPETPQAEQELRNYLFTTAHNQSLAWAFEHMVAASRSVLTPAQHTALVRAVENAGRGKISREISEFQNAIAELATALSAQLQKEQKKDAERKQLDEKMVQHYAELQRQLMADRVEISRQLQTLERLLLHAGGAPSGIEPLKG
jgi:hypothetical protein